MRGGKRPHGGGKPKLGKKPKRSKQFWQQRKTVEIAPIPKDESDESSSSEDGEETRTHYDDLLTAYASGATNGTNAVESSEEGDSETEEEENDGSDDEIEEEDEDERSEVEGEIEEDVDGQDEAESGEEEEREDDDEEEENNDLELESEESDEDEAEDANSTPQIDQTGGPKDPFVARYELKIDDSLHEAVKERNLQQEILKWRKLGRLTYIFPKWEPESNSQSLTKPMVSVDDEAEHPEIRKAQQELMTSPITPMTSDKGGLERQFVKMQLARNVSVANIKNLTDTKMVFTAFQQELFGIVNSYRDFSFNERTYENGEQIRLIYTLHALNHSLKTRTKIINNNARLSQAMKDGKKKKKKVEDKNINLRDQGLVRPKVLIIVPFRESARRIVDLMIKLLFNKDSTSGTVMKKKRFDDEFGVDEGEVVTTGRKPEDFYQIFAGNIDDGFKLGVSVTKKAIKLYSDFYSSDILLASPLGLRMVLETDSDFLSSIELLIMDQVDVFAMQNWEHVTFLMEKLHCRPSKSHGVDFSRVRLWTLDEMSPLYRQTLLFASMPMVETNAIFNRSCHNYLGKILTVNPEKTGTISRVIISGVPMTFHRVDTSSVSSSIDDRFNYFVQKVMPEYKKDLMYHTLIFVPSYFDFVRLRNWFSKSDLDFSEISEYTKEKRIAEYRDLFFHGEKHFLLYTERSHFYKRLTIKGIRHLIFYQLPQNPHFFPELCNLMQPAFLNRKGGSDGNMTCTALYTKYDNMRLASVCSTSKAEFMINAQKNVHLFMAGGASV